MTFNDLRYFYNVTKRATKGKIIKSSYREYELRSINILLKATLVFIVPIIIVLSITLITNLCI